ncbi:DNA-methyltransferase [Shinella sp. M31]|uniref:DNA-methyltransferase n=1 Tax=Shinella sp. M31 TaxID=3368615 RepID=UPI003B9F3502
MTVHAIDQAITERYAIYQGDCCELIRAVPDASIGFGIHSPPFEGLYRFSNSERDISNNEGAAFWDHYGFLIGELLRVTKAGRLHAVHCMQLPTSKTRDGFIGMRDFRGEIVRAYQAAGWIFHSEICIWKDPVVAQQRTKSIRLLHKQLVKDSAISGQGLADYMLVFRKAGDNDAPVSGMLDRFVGEGLDVTQDGYDAYCRQGRAARSDFKPWPFEMWRSVLIWQRYASPVWMDIRQTRTLQYRAARDHQDEQHISPLQLDVIERCIDLWSAPGETVLTPFLGIGSEVYVAADRGRKGIGFELKDTYFRQAKRNLAELDKPEAQRLFEDESAAALEVSDDV